MDQETLRLIVSVSGTIAGVLVTAWFGRRNLVRTLEASKSTEHETWLRNQRQEAYVEYLGVAEKIIAMTQSDLMAPMKEPPIEELRVQSGKLRLIGTPDIFREGVRLYHTVQRAVVERHAVDRYAPGMDTEDEEARTAHMISLTSSLDEYAAHISHYVDLVRAEVGAGMEVLEYTGGGVRPQRHDD